MKRNIKKFNEFNNFDFDYENNYGDMDEFNIDPLMDDDFDIDMEDDILADETEDSIERSERQLNFKKDSTEELEKKRFDKNYKKYWRQIDDEIFSRPRRNR
jgi:hypothetical protein